MQRQGEGVCDGLTPGSETERQRVGEYGHGLFLQCILFVNEADA